MSSFKKATQSSRNNDTNASPARAVDKDITTCSSTWADNPAWWYVDLEEIKSIHDIQVFFNGTDTANEHRQRERMYGYQLYASNTTDLRNLDMMHHCYNHSGPALPDLTSNHVCTTFGRYVIFYNERIPGVTYPNSNGGNQHFTYVQLCEIIVYGCDTLGTYGDNCFKRCSSKCQERRCDIINGTCLGCTEGWTGDKCEFTCPEGYHGLECRGICSNNCLRNRTCNHVTGNCDNGCSDGWTGGRCNITCTMGTYGAGCSQNCSGNCKNGTSCNRVTGFCDSGCSPGYIGERCKKACSMGTYGSGCSKNCSGNCKNDTTCDRVTGFCDSGCSPGFTGKRCDQVCTPGTYGPGCQRNCSGNCINGTFCNATTGVCDSGCSSGYIGKRCDQECPVGTFGEDCTGNCSRNCLNNETCSNIDGRCNNGCKAGFQGFLCDKRCAEGTYGNCKQTCSGQCANNETCNYVDGICNNGCNPGYYGEKCSSSCSPGRYGQNCSYICSENCKDAKCDHVYGKCICKQGWKGLDCSTECSVGTFGENCLKNCSGHCSNNEMCSNTNGECPNGCQSNYKGVTCHELKPTKEKPQPLIIGIVVLFLLLVIIIIMTVIIVKRRNRLFKNIHDFGHLNAVFSSKKELTGGKNTEFHSYENDIAKSEAETKNISIGDLSKTIEEMFENDTSFKAEYEQIPNGELHLCDAGKRDENKIKNRYKTTFPYDHSRVKLQVENMRSDYINANYIKDISGEQRYIATQGPKKETVADFWAMIWQEYVNVIVCLTNLKEGKQKKCQQYWPDCHDKIQNGNFAIRNQEEKTYSNYIKRHLRLQDTIGKEEKDVWMFHYTQWPDHGVPEAINLVVFHRHVQRVFAESPDNSKIVVHCSAGLGRTGTFIALDALYRNGLTSRSVNVSEYVTQMRHDRMNMVQGEEQYKMIYMTVHESFRGHLRPVTAESFLSNHQTLNCKHQEDEIKKEQETDDFKELTLLKIQYDATERSAQNNDAFNFTPIVMPVEKYRCHLLSDDDTPVYYNAVILQSFTKPNGPISAQYPLEKQCEDFLYLVKESRAGTVVFLGPLEDIPSTKIWFPSKNDSKTVGKFSVKMRKCDPSTVVTKTNIIIQGKGFKDIPLSVLECNFWKSDALIADCRKVLEAIKETRLEESTHSNNRTIVFSSDGAKRCGPFCVAYNVIEQFILDKEIDIFTATRLIQIRRPEFISTPEEYQFCHDLVAEYLQADTDYANLDFKP
ncbi:receptor-type tyrosine-protein phosphatase alpha-like [Saccostrea cucullata]|uniref:receptor-type tyrosine-protein phosphatase alpha-like n=1 Tax=Saccostrea cuccullata TaxID=36930 RepID=UPI002ED3FEE8